MAYSGGYILGCDSPTIGNDKSQYSAKFDASMAAVDNHDHTTGKGRPIGTLGIADLSITAAKVAANAITTDKVNALAITGAKMAAATITGDKLAALGHAISASTGALAGTLDGAWWEFFEDGTSDPIEAPLTTTGRPVILSLIAGDGAGDLSSLNIGKSGGGPFVRFRFLRDGVQIGSDLCMGTDAEGIELPPSVFQTFDAPAAGSYTYTVEYKGASGQTLNINGVKLLARELK